MSVERNGRLIAFEGIEGAGKSTHIDLAAAALERAGQRVTVTVEPGGTELGRVLRALVLKSRSPAPSPLAELFVYLADRAQHVTEVIRPALNANHIVLTDRFSASTLAYQGYARGLDINVVKEADAWARMGISPHLNVLLDCPVVIGLARARGSDRFHAEMAEFHERVREGFLALAAADPACWHVVDATQPRSVVHESIMRAILESLRRP